MDKLNGNRVDMTKEVRSMEEMGTAMGRLSRVCEERKITLVCEEIPNEYFIYHQDKGVIIVSPSSKEHHISLMVDFLAYIT